MLTSLKVRTGVVNPPPESLDSREVRRLPLEDVTVVHSLLGRTATGEAIPVVRLTPGHPSGRLTVVGDPRGKAALATGSGEPTAMVRALLARGHEVVGFDPLFVGESLDPRDPVPHRPDVVHFETYNPAGRRADAGPRHGARLVPRPGGRARGQSHRPGHRRLSALVARPLLKGLARTVIELAALPKVSGDREVRIWPTTLDLPGLESSAGRGLPPRYRHRAALALQQPLGAQTVVGRVRLRARRRGFDAANGPGRPGPRRDRALGRPRGLTGPHLRGDRRIGTSSRRAREDYWSPRRFIL